MRRRRTSGRALPHERSSSSSKNRRRQTAVRSEDGIPMGRRRSSAHNSRVLLIPILLLCSCSRPAATVPEPAKTARITQFYARDPMLPKGEKTMLCYGVENAKAVRIQQHDAYVGPALSYSFEIAPYTAQTYTLTPEGV